MDWQRRKLPQTSAAVYCGTPENVGPVVAGDVMTGHIDGIYEIKVKVV